MQVDVKEIGRSKSRVVVIDDFLPQAERAIAAAAVMAPFPPESATAYPGRRCQIGPADAASVYVKKTLQSLVPVIQSSFGAASFNVVEASFSLVTTPPDALTTVQRLPHYDFADPDMLAVLHHLHHIPDTGTSFYRHISSGLEGVDAQTAPLLKQALAADVERLGPVPDGFTADGNDRYEQILHVEGRFNRLLIYQGCLLHSGIIPPDFNFSPDPRHGRLTGNMFVRLVRRQQAR